MKRKTQKNEYSFSKILDLAEAGNLPELKRLISLDQNLIHQQGEIGTNLLMSASMSGHLELVKFFVEMGADVDCTDRDGSFALLYAATGEAWGIFDYLFDLTDRELKAAAVYIAAIDGEAETLKALIERKVDVDAFRLPGVWCDRGFTALIAVIVQGEEELTEIVQILLQAGANPNLPEEDTGGTPLMYAAKRGCLPILHLLLKAGAATDIKDAARETALTKAEKFGNDEVVEIIRHYTAPL